MLILTVIQGPDKGRRIELPDHEPQQIGRSSEAIHLHDQTISRRHAELTPDGRGGWAVRDLQSANGTFVNGVRVTAARTLKVGDQVRCGNSLIVFGEGQDPQSLSNLLRVARRGELEVNLEASVASNEESLIMSSPEPAQAAEMQLGVLYELLGTLASVTEKQDLMDKVMDTIFDYFQADRAFILLREDPKDEDSPVAPAVVRRRDALGAVAPGGLNADGTPITFSRTIVQYVMRKRVGVLTSNAMNDTRFTTGDSIQAYGIRSAMCVPIRYKDRLYGVLHLDTTIANYTFTEDQLSLLTAVGVETGLALANLRLIEARVKAERLAAAGQTVASLSHSIKNILQGMRGGADVVELGLRKQNLAVVNNGWEIVARNQERIYELTMNMLQFAKQRKPELEMQQIGPVIEDVVALVQKQFDAKGVALIQDLAADLPPVPIQASGIHQALLNLLSNALDACEGRHGVVTLAARYDTHDDRLVLRISDTGEGMSEEVRRKLFEPFHSTKGYGGTGLGLVVTKKIVDEHGGEVRVDSEPGKGTTFSLLLSLDVTDAPASADTQGPGISLEEVPEPDPFA